MLKFNYDIHFKKINYDIIHKYKGKLLWEKGIYPPPPHTPKKKKKFDSIVRKINYILKTYFGYIY